MERITKVKVCEFPSTKKVPQLKLFQIKEANRKNKANFLEQQFQILSKFLLNNPNCELRDIKIDEQIFFDILLNILDKYERSLYEIQTVKLFLKTLTNFMEMLKGIQHNSNCGDILTRVSHHLKREHFKEGKLIFRTGDIGDKFYIILKGKIAILVASPKIIKMSLKDYVLYLLRLKKEEEYQILTNTINANKHIYKVSEQNLDKKMSNKQSNFDINPATKNNEKSFMQEHVIDPEQFEKNIKEEVEYKDRRAILVEYFKKLNPIESKSNALEDIVLNINRNNSDSEDLLIGSKCFSWNKGEILNDRSKPEKNSLEEIPIIINKQEVNKKFKTIHTFKPDVTDLQSGKPIKTNFKENLRNQYFSRKTNENSLDSINELDESRNNKKDQEYHNSIKNQNKNNAYKAPSKFITHLQRSESKSSQNLKQLSIEKLNFADSTQDNNDGLNKHNELREVTVWEYSHILTLEKGDVFGELALESVNSKRTATLIALKDSHCGVLTQEVYEDCLKDTYEKQRKNNINYILSSTIFHGCHSVNFEKKLFNYFVNIKLRQGELLIEENTSADFIYFIKDGEYEVETNRSINDINCFIKNLGGNVDLKHADNYICSPIFEKFYQKKLKIKISIVKNKDVIGLSDFVYDSKYIFNTRLISVTGNAFKINKKFYESMCQSDEVILENSEKFKSKKKKILLEKLIRIREIKIAMFKDFSSIRDKSNSGINLNLESKNKYENFLTSSIMDSKTKETHLFCSSSNKNLKLGSFSMSKEDEKRFLNLNLNGNSSLADTPIKIISKFSPQPSTRNLLLSMEKSKEKITRIFNLKTVRKKNSLDFSPQKTKELFSVNSQSICKSGVKSPFSVSEYNEFERSAPQKRSITTGKKEFENNNFLMNSMFKSKTKIPMPGVTKRIILSRRGSFDKSARLKIDGKISEVAVKIKGISEMNPVLVSNDKMILYEIMEKIRNIKPDQKKNGENRAETELNIIRPNTDYKFNLIDCLVVDKIVEKTKNEAIYFPLFHNDVGLYAGNHSSAEFKKNKAKIISKSISNFNLNNYSNPMKNTIKFCTRENFPMENNSPKIYSSLMKISEKIN